MPRQADIQQIIGTMVFFLYNVAAEFNNLGNGTTGEATTRRHITPRNRTTAASGDDQTSSVYYSTSTGHYDATSGTSSFLPPAPPPGGDVSQGFSPGNIALVVAASLLLLLLYASYRAKPTESPRVSAAPVDPSERAELLEADEQEDRLSPSALESGRPGPNRAEPQRAIRASENPYGTFPIPSTASVSRGQQVIAAAPAASTTVAKSRSAVEEEVLDDDARNFGFGS